MTGINAPNGLIAAAAASFNKGQETTRDAAGEMKERLRVARQIVANSKLANEQKKPEGAKKGFLA